MTFTIFAVPAGPAPSHSPLTSYGRALRHGPADVLKRSTMKNKKLRLTGFDYSQNGAYFITIVTKNRQRFFGEISNKEMTLSSIGEFVEQNFKMIRSKMKIIRVDEYAIMPDHLHLLLVINNTDSPEEHPYLRERPIATGIHPLQKQSVSSFVNHLKGTIKRWCNEQGFPQFAWQARFNESIIKNESHYHIVTNYIQSNVKNWGSR